MADHHDLAGTLDVEEVLAALTPAEKAALCMGGDYWHTTAIDRLEVPGVMVADGPHGLRAKLGEGDTTGISGSAPATCFPTASALASSWDPALLEEIGTALAAEARALGVSVVLGPGINLKRSPLCGRNFEYLSEDPWLTGELATAMVTGLQARGIGASLKHYAANNQEHDRARVNVDVDERTLREVYLAGFERVVTEAQPWTVMCAYNRINGTHASQHQWLLGDVLRGDWGFEGLVVSDWGAVHDRVAALEAGLDLEMPPAHGISDVAVVEAVRNGTLDEAVLDRSVRRVLELAKRSITAAPDEGAAPDLGAHHALARRAATRSAVLLRNQDGVLPLEPAAGSTIAVLGPFATEPRFQGAGSSQVTPTRIDVPLEELERVVGEDVTVRFAPGFERDPATSDGDRHAEAARLREEAVALATEADHVVLFLGLPPSLESEGFDRADMRLPGEQIALVEAVAAVHDAPVVVLANGAAVEVADWIDHTAAVLECWLGGQAAGGAVAALLLGEANPAGKLAETIPQRLQDTPSYLNFPGEQGTVRYGEGVFVGYRGHDARGQDVAFPFGFGLSYTTFEVADVAVEASGSVAGDDLRVEVRATVTNTGEVAGAEVVQVYVGDPVATVARPVRELRGAARVELDPGEQATVRIQLGERAFAFWSTPLGRWVVEAGLFVIDVGTSSRDILATRSLELAAPSITPPLTDWSTVEEWLADPDGRALLERVAPAGMLDDEELLPVIATMPMRTIAAFGAGGFDRDDLQDWIDELRAG